MVTLTHAYTSAQKAETAVERLLSADVPAVRIQLLVDAGLEPAIATGDVDALHAGRVLVLVQGESALEDVQQTLRAAA